MIWHAFNLARGCSPEYFALDDATVGRHQRLLWACASANGGRGNSGVWRDSSSWNDRTWARYTGLDKEQLEDLVASGLARWVTREVADELVNLLTPTEEQTHEEDFEWERCRVTSEALDAVERRTLSIDRRDVSIDRRGVSIAIDEVCRSRSTSCVDRDRSQIDLVVFDYDLGGQVKAQLISEMKRNAANVRWNRAKQLELPTSHPGAGGEDDAARRSRSTQLVDRDRHTAGDARAMHSHSHSTQRSPPYPPHGGRFEVEASREEAGQLDAFWGWFLGARPRALNGALWGGGKAQSLTTLLRKARERGIAVADFLAGVRSDLEAKFADTRWVLDWSEAGRGFRSYVNLDDWESPLPPAGEPLRPQVDERAQARAAAAAEARERAELAEVWAAEIPDRPFPADLDEARRALRERWHRRGDAPS